MWAFPENIYSFGFIFEHHICKDTYGKSKKSWQWKDVFLGCDLKLEIRNKIRYDISRCAKRKLLKQALLLSCNLKAGNAALKWLMVAPSNKGETNGEYWCLNSLKKNTNTNIKGKQINICCYLQLIYKWGNCRKKTVSWERWGTDKQSMAHWTLKHDLPYQKECTAEIRSSEMSWWGETPVAKFIVHWGL